MDKRFSRIFLVLTLVVMGGLSTPASIMGAGFAEANSSSAPTYRYDKVEEYVMSDNRIFELAKSLFHPNNQNKKQMTMARAVLKVTRRTQHKGKLHLRSDEYAMIHMRSRQFMLLLDELCRSSHDPAVTKALKGKYETAFKACYRLLSKKDWRILEYYLSVLRKQGKTTTTVFDERVAIGPKTNVVFALHRICLHAKERAFKILADFGFEEQTAKEMTGKEIIKTLKSNSKAMTRAFGLCIFAAHGGRPQVRRLIEYFKLIIWSGALLHETQRAYSKVEDEAQIVLQKLGGKQ